MSKPSRPAPPPPSRPGHVQVVRALYSYVAQQNDELSFQEGDTLYIIDKSSGDGWWKGKVGDKVGLVPSNYVQESTETIDNPLHEAAKRGNLPFLRECLDNKVSVNGLDKSGSTPLHWAAAGGHTDCVVELLKIPRIEINVQNKLGDTPLHNATWKGHPDIVELLLEKGANKKLRNNENRLPYDLSRDPDTGRLLKDVKITDVSGYGDEEDSD